MYKKFLTHIEAQNFIEGKCEVSVTLNDNGSSFNNSTTKAQAGIGVFWKDDDPNNLSERLPGSEQTNNRAEIYAVIRALEVCENKTKPLEIMTDSKYAINIIEDWVEKWEKNGYMSYNNTPVKNQDLIKRLKKLIDNRIGIVRLIHVRGHWGNY
ncbi:20768_t:CDS:2, partial [Racocetra persica]